MIKEYRNDFYNLMDLIMYFLEEVKYENLAY